MRKIGIYVTSITIIIFIIFTCYILSTSSLNINPQILITDKNDNEIAYITNNHKSSTTKLDELAGGFIDKLIFIEDKDFYIHNGFNIKRIIKSAYTNITQNKTQGASTITQQYIKNTYLSNKQTIIRKLKELALAIRIENIKTKDEILSEYLSVVYFGNDVYGINNASIYYFNKKPKDLSTHEQIALIALLKSPSSYSSDYDKWNQRIKIYSTILYENTLITYDEYQTTIAPIKTSINENYISSNKAYFIDTVLEEFNKEGFISKFGSKIKIKTMYNNKTEVITTSQDISYSLIAVNKDGYITALIGDKNYHKSQYNIALNGNRDIGSTIKPLLYYEAIKCGFKDKKFLSSPYSLKYKDTSITISNNSGNYYHSEIDMKTALATSDNIYAVKMHMMLGMHTLANSLKDYGIRCDAIPSLALGSVGMSLLDLTKIYTQFFLDGMYVNPRCIYKITVNNKEYTYKPSAYQNLDANICLEIKDMMKGVFSNKIKYSTCGWLKPYLKQECYGKSGLTDYDSYMIGFTENDLVSVWCGHADNSLLLDKYHKRLPKELFIKAINLVSPSSAN